MIEVLTIFGTRPEVIKMPPPMRELGSIENRKSIVCVMRQYRTILVDEEGYQLMSNAMDTYANGTASILNVYHIIGSYGKGSQK